MPASSSTYQKPRATPWVLRLYVRGMTGKAQEALRNLKTLCEARIPNLYEIEVVDIEEEVQRAIDDAILAVPMLVRLEPKPMRRIIGNLSDVQRLAFALDIKMQEPNEDANPDDRSFSS